MSGGMVGMGSMDMDSEMNPEMAMAMGITGGPDGAKLGDIMGAGAGPDMVEWKEWKEWKQEWNPE